MEAAQKKAQQMIDDNAVIVFSKSYCPFCRNTKEILDGFGAKYAHYELNQEDDGDEIQAALLQISGQRTVPNVFVGKEHIGGNSDLVARKDGDLRDLLRAAGALE